MATYLPIKRGGYRAKRSTPARGAKGGSKTAYKSRTKAKAKRRSNGRAVLWSKSPIAATGVGRISTNVPRGFHLGRGVRSGTWLRYNAPSKSKSKKKRRPGTWKKGWAKKLKTTHRSTARSFKRSNPYRGNQRGAKTKYRTRTVVAYKTNRLRNPVGFDGQDSLKSLGTWGKVGIGVLFGLGGFIVAFGIPKGLAVATGMDSFQRGWGGVATAGVVSVGASLAVGMVSPKAGYAVLVASLTATAILALNAINARGAQAVIPVNEAVLAAMLPTYEAKKGTGPADYLPGGSRVNQPTQYLPDSRPARLPGGRGPSDFNPAMRGPPSSEAVGRESSYHSRALAPKERF